MNHSKKFFYNSVASAVYQFVVVIVAFITPRIMLTTYGSEVNGLVNSISQFISYFFLIEAGLAQSSMLSLYKPLAEKDYKKASGIVVAAKKLYNKTGYIYLTALITLALIYPIFIKTNVLDPVFISLLVIAVGFAGALEFFTMSKYRVLLAADEKTYIISIANTVSTILNTLIVVLMAYMGVNVVLLKFVALISVLSRSIILFIYVKVKYKFIDYNTVPDNSAINKKFDSLYIQVMNSIYLGAPTVLVTLFLDLKSVSVFSIYNMVTKSLHGAFFVITNGLTATFGQLIATRRIKRLREVYDLFQFTFFSVITIAYSVTFVTYLSFIKLYTSGVTDANYIVIELAFLFATKGLLESIKTPFRMLVSASGLYKETRVQSTIESIITVLFGAILAPRYGLTGILIAAIIANIYRCVDLVRFISKNVLSVNVKYYFWKILRIFLVILIVYLFSTIIDYDPNSYLNWVIYSSIIGGFAIVIVIITSLIFERHSVIYIYKKIYNKIMRKIT